MDILMMIAAFGGGVFGAFMGALPVFILVGIVGLAGLTAVTGAPIDLVGGVAFGPFLGPHIAFGGGVAAAAYAHRKGKLDGGGNILAALIQYNDPSILIVGGVFGVLAYMVNYLYGTVLHIPTDTVAMTVFTSGLIARLVFGKTGIIGKTDVAGRAYFPNAQSLALLATLGIGVGAVSSYYTVTTGVVTLAFCISAASLMFAQMGFAVPGTHHISLVSAYAASATGNIGVGIAFGIIAAIVGEVIQLVFNSHGDSHIDPPAGTIFILSLLIFTFMK